MYDDCESNLPSRPALPTRTEDAPVNTDPILYHDSIRPLQYSKQEEGLLAYTIRPISTGAYEAPAQVEQPKPQSKKGKKGENPQLHFSFVTHRVSFIPTIVYLILHNSLICRWTCLLMRIVCCTTFGHAAPQPST